MTTRRIPRLFTRRSLHPSRRVSSWLAGLLVGASALASAATADAQTIRDTEIEEILHEFTEPILLAAGLDPQAVDLYIVNDRSLNAFVTRGQNIFLHTGLILEADTPNQLKGVIAHETGHIADGRLARSDYQNRSAYGAILAAAGLGLAAILAGEGAAGAAILGGSQQFGALEVLRHTRVGESVADQYAAQYMEQTGQSGEGLIQFFDKFRYQEVLSQARRFPYFRSHPLSSERIDQLRERVAESPFRDVRDPEADLYSMAMMQAKLIGFLESPQRVFSKFPESDTTDEARYARSVAFFRSGQLNAALREVDALIEFAPLNPFYHELKAQFLYESGRSEDAIAPIQEAIRLKPDAPLFHIALAQALIERGTTQDFADAEAALQRAIDQESGNASAWYYLSQAYGRQRKQALAEYATAEQSFAVGNFLRAKQFAERAQSDLPRNAPAWRRAGDIVAVSEVQLARKDRGRGAHKPFRATVGGGSAGGNIGGGVGGFAPRGAATPR